MIFIKQEKIRQLKSALTDLLLKPTLRLILGEKKLQNIQDIENFTKKRSAHITQSTLYGYLRTRIGVRYVSMFQDEVFLKSINIARWNIFSVATQDLLNYIFSYLYVSQNFRDLDETKRIYKNILLEQTTHGLTNDIIEKSLVDYEKRFKEINWNNYYAQDPFKDSSHALFYWSPIADELKELDKEIVINSMQLKWINIAEEFRQLIRPIK
jgi:hypothetical protein